jgi:hypothetical protein
MVVSTLFQADMITKLIHTCRCSAIEKQEYLVEIYSETAVETFKEIGFKSHHCMKHDKPSRERRRTVIVE